MSITKNQLVLQIAAQTGLDQQAVKRTVQLVLDRVIEILATEGRLELRNFGVFGVRIRKARKCRNPKTGDEILVGKRKAVLFKAGKAMEQALKAGVTRR